MRLNHRTAIVTGASMGIGASTALLLAKRGVTVWAVARSEDRLLALAERHPGIRPVVADLCVPDDRDALYETTGPVDILVNNAGIAVNGMVETMPFESIQHMFELNVLAAIDLSQRLLPDMLRRRSGHICNVGSSISYIPGPPLTAYAATKYAIGGFSDGLRREVIDRNVRVSLIQPGPVKTAFWDRAAGGDRYDVNESSGFGCPPEWVANSIAKAIRLDHVPGYSTVAVPRPVGFGRLLDLPGISLAMDWAGTMKQRVPLPIVEEDAEVIPISNARNSDRKPESGD